MFCKGGGKPKILDLFADLQNKMHYLNDVQDLGRGQTNVCGVFSDGMQGRSSWVLNAKYEFSLFLGTFQSKFWNICYFIQIKYLVFSCMHKQGIIRFLLLKPPAKVLDMHEQEIKLGYKIMASEVRLKNFGDNNIK